MSEWGMGARGLWAWALGLALVSAGGCKAPPGDGGPAAAAPAAAQATGPVRVATLFHPTAWITAQVGGAQVQVIDLLPSDEDAATWQPPPAAIQALQGAERIILNGAGFERGLAMVSLPPSRVVHTAQGFKAEWIHRAAAPAHRHGDGPAHSHSGLDGHTWLDPVLLTAQAKAVRDALTAARPAQQAAFARGYDALAARLAALDAQWRALPMDRPVLANHPAYDYLARRYGWTVDTVDVAPDAPPTAAQVQAVRAAQRRRQASLMLWEAMPSAEVLAALQGIGLRHVVVAPAEQVGPGADYGTVMAANIDRLARALAAPPRAQAPDADAGVAP